MSNMSMFPPIPDSLTRGEKTYWTRRGMELPEEPAASRITGPDPLIGQKD